MNPREKPAYFASQYRLDKQLIKIHIKMQVKHLCTVYIYIIKSNFNHSNGQIRRSTESWLTKVHLCLSLSKWPLWMQHATTRLLKREDRGGVPSLTTLMCMNLDRQATLVKPVAIRQTAGSVELPVVDLLNFFCFSVLQTHFSQYLWPMDVLETTLNKLKKIQYTSSPSD